MGKHDLLFSFSSSNLPTFSACMQFLATQKKALALFVSKWADSCYALDACAWRGEASLALPRPFCGIAGGGGGGELMALAMMMSGPNGDRAAAKKLSGTG